MIMIEAAKFIVGEKVKVHSALAPQYDIEETEVVFSDYIERGRLSTDTLYNGWVYKTAHQPDMEMVWREESLKKIPPNTISKWEDCVWQPNDLTEPNF